MRVADYHNHQSSVILWQKVEIAAIDYPNGSCLLALPVCVALFIKTIAFIPANIIEQGYLAGKAMEQYKVVRNDRLHPDTINYEIQVLEFAKCIFISPFLAMYTLIWSIDKFVRILLNPLKTSKIELANQQFALFVRQNFNVNRGYNTFTNKSLFAKGTLNRYIQKISQATERDTLLRLHFLDREETTREILAEVEAKDAPWQEAKRAYRHFYSNLDNINDNNAFLIQKERLLRSWNRFQINFYEATQEEAAAMAFNFREIA